mmetsp:Transcript_78522/g.199772  ORF Transcript_78522/g.199772 Transcript_78522/m.199772 type:complete len:208 (+) Transcript_78522:455-1078(+)
MRPSPHRISATPQRSPKWMCPGAQGCWESRSTKWSPEQATRVRARQPRGLLVSRRYLHPCTTFLGSSAGCTAPCRHPGDQRGWGTFGSRRRRGRKGRETRSSRWHRHPAARLGRSIAQRPQAQDETPRPQDGAPRPTSRPSARPNVGRPPAQRPGAARTRARAGRPPAEVWRRPTACRRGAPPAEGHLQGKHPSQRLKSNSRPTQQM